MPLKKHINTNNTKRIHGTVYLNAYCAWGKIAKCEKSLEIILKILSRAAQFFVGVWAQYRSHN